MIRKLMIEDLNAFLIIAALTHSVVAIFLTVFHRDDGCIKWRLKVGDGFSVHIQSGKQVLNMLIDDLHFRHYTYYQICRFYSTGIDMPSDLYHQRIPSTLLPLEQLDVPSSAADHLERSFAAAGPSVEDS
eukprot:TRINITY_DN11644_c0_g1_i12.p4 TRINITY_DN11644_c0_g1~~TRINITY_DN11644_c0_g1_i12.p4  ORF type:complete len:130 (-),score=10.64 TRINITY_DN11644_c0_g1_i12:28-417(-)